jgi:hypothetical protein
MGALLFRLSLIGARGAKQIEGWRVVPIGDDCALGIARPPVRQLLEMIAPFGTARQRGKTRRSSVACGFG